MTDIEFYSFEDIARANKVVPLSKVREVLKLTEPVEQHLLQTDGSSRVRVTMPDNWNYDLKALDDSIITTCKIEVLDRQYSLSKRAILTILGMIGISDRYAFKTPGHLLEPHINYWFENGGVGQDDDLKMVTKDNYAVGFMRSAYPIVSNLDVLDQIELFFEKRGMKQEIYVDPHIVNNYVQTEFRLILSEESFDVRTVRNGVEETDTWYIGIHVTNSLISSATRPLSLAGFLIEQKSLAGILPELSSLNGYNRNADVDIDDLNGWIASTVDQVMSILPAEAEMLKHMPDHSLKGNIGTLTTDIYRSMKVHRKVQEIALENLTVSGDMTSYGILHSLSKAVASPSGERQFPSKIVNHVQRVCGTLPSRTEDICDSCGRLHLFD